MTSIVRVQKAPLSGFRVTETVSSTPTSCMTTLGMFQNLDSQRLQMDISNSKSSNGNHFGGATRSDVFGQNLRRPIVIKEIVYAMCAVPPTTKSLSNYDEHHYRLKLQDASFHYKPETFPSCPCISPQKEVPNARAIAEHKLWRIGCCLAMMRRMIRINFNLV
ncbi:hypothetical protein CCR75_002376 [Bremia lactucae]|uniref:Uncharacterized protein n=1 Tax=Bremia lactucae TaxID=4779 RepID=A0A976FMV7_BRELC|nr:hypothetical protein CCR75_002376 [Bremia lactucae]